MYGVGVINTQGKVILAAVWLYTLIMAAVISYRLTLQDPCTLDELDKLKEVATYCVEQEVDTEYGCSKWAMEEICG